MNKCDFCPSSKNVKGKLVCPYRTCWLSSKDIEKAIAFASKLNLGRYDREED